MRGFHDAGGVMQIHACIAFGSKLRLAGVQAHADAHRHALWPGMASQCTLPCYRRGDSIAGTSKGHEEGITLRDDLVTVILQVRRLNAAWHRLPAVEEKDFHSSIVALEGAHAVGR